MKIKITVPNQEWLDHFSSDGYRNNQILELTEAEYEELDARANSFNHEVFGPAITLEIMDGDIK